MKFLILLLFTFLLTSCGNTMKNAKHLFDINKSDLFYSKKANSINDLPDVLAIGKYKVNLKPYKSTGTLGADTLEEIKNNGATLLNSKISVKMSKKGWLVFLAKIKYRPTSIGCKVAGKHSKSCLTLYTKQQLDSNKKLQETVHQARAHFAKHPKNIDKHSVKELKAMSDIDFLNVIQKSAVLVHKEKLMIPIVKIGKKIAKAIRSGKNPLDMDLLHEVVTDKNSVFKKRKSKLKKKKKHAENNPLLFEKNKLDYLDPLNFEDKNQSKTCGDSEISTCSRQNTANAKDVVSIAWYGLYDEYKWEYSKSIETFWKTYSISFLAKVYYDLSVSVPINTKARKQGDYWTVSTNTCNANTKDYAAGLYPHINHREFNAGIGADAHIAVNLWDSYSKSFHYEYNLTDNFKQKGEYDWPDSNRANEIVSYKIPVDLLPVILADLNPTIGVYLRGKEIYGAIKEDFFAMNNQSIKVRKGDSIQDFIYKFGLELDLGLNLRLGFEILGFDFYIDKGFTLVPLYEKDFYIGCKYNCLINL